MKNEIIDIVSSLENELNALSLKIYENPELGYEEFLACKLHIELLEKYGFDVEKEYCGVKTGFKATYKAAKEGLTVAYLSEYDALPGIGHGCGHNLLGTMSTGAGITLKQIIDEIGGTVVVFGTPAEETSGAKVTFAEQGAFDNIDIALVAHPSSEYKNSGSSMALHPIQFEFFGKTAHAASAPEKGINALDGAICTINNINALREHIRSDSRVHGVILEGGKAANIVPDYAKVQYYVRSTTKTYNTELVEKIKNCAKAGALATGTELKMTQYEFSYDNMVTNELLSETFNDSLYEIANIKVGPAPTSTGSTDTGQVSQKCPSIHPYVDVTGDTSIIGHSIEMAAATIKPYAIEQMKNVVAGLTLTAVKVMTDNKLYQDIRYEFENAEK